MKLKDLIKKLKARQILTSRGIPTVEVELTVQNSVIRSSVPSGKSKGDNEAKILVDESNSYFGKSVLKVVDHLNSDAIRLLNVDSNDPKEFDEFLIYLDGTDDKSRFGANYILPLSIGCYKAFANSLNMSLWRYLQSFTKSKYSIPVPYFNILNGGVHSGNGISCQEVMVSFRRPTFTENLELAVEMYYSLHDLISTKYGSLYTSVGDEGGFAPPIKNLREGLDLILECAKKINCEDLQIGLDLAANSFYSEKGYDFDGEILSGKALADLFIALTKDYPITSLEDPFAETDIESWKYFYEAVGSKITIIADDLTTTNPKTIEKLKGCFNGVLIKPNQIGTVSETIKAIQVTKELGMKVMVSHRSAETEDTFIVHLAVGMGADYIKSGAPSRGERVMKYNELLRIEEEINE